MSHGPKQTDAGHSGVQQEQAPQGATDRDALLRQLAEPVQALANALVTRGYRSSAAGGTLALVEQLAAVELVPQDLAARYRDLYHAVRYAPTAPDAAAVRDIAEAIANALPSVDTAVAKLCRSQAVASESGPPAAEHVQATPRRGAGWSRPPYQPTTSTDVALLEAEAPRRVTVDARIWRRFLLSLLICALLLGWSATVAAVTFYFHEPLARLAYRIKHGRWPRPAVDRYTQQLLERVSAPELSEEERARVMLELAQRFYELGEWVKAEHFYRAALERRPNDPEIMNNLAWLLLTRGDRWFQDVKQGFRLAKRAAELKPAPHIRDTLAEAYYLMGQYEEAVRIEEGVLRDEPGNPFYKEQLKKFRRALEAARGKKANGQGEQPGRGHEPV